MCGIAGVYLRQPFKEHADVETFADSMLKSIEHRGRRATGIVTSCSGGHRVMLDKKPISASEFVKVRKAIPEDSNIILMHTRLDTKGSPSNPNNNHPIVYRSTFITHNGGIWNDDALFEDEGLSRNGEVDSEIIAALLAEETFDHAETALSKLEGDFAVAAMSPVDFPDQLLLAKGAWSPMYVWETDFFLAYASTESTIQSAMRAIGVEAPSSDDLYEFDTGEMWMVTPNGVDKGSFTPAVDDNGSLTRKETRRAQSQTSLNRGWMSGGRYGDNDYTNVGSDYWVKCEDCESHVPYRETSKTIDGTFCEDCHKDWLAKMTPTTDSKLFISTDEKRVLDLWCATDANVHERVIQYVSEATVFSKETVEWLIFRAPQSYLQSHANMKELAEYLDEVYQEEYEKEWTQFNKITAASDDSASKGTVKETDDTVPPPLEAIEIGSCGVQVTQEEAEAASDDDPTDVDGEVIPFPKALPRGRSKDFSCFSAETYSDKCRVCMTDAVSRLGKFVWCARHTEKCNAVGCKNARPANRTDTTGRRLCHDCARGVQGVLTDSQLANRNLSIEGIRA